MSSTFCLELEFDKELKKIVHLKYAEIMHRRCITKRCQMTKEPQGILNDMAIVV